MKENIFSNIKKPEGIFKREESLYPEYLPERLPFREPEIDQLVYSFSPVLQGKKPLNVIAFGPPGSGKTATVKYVLNELHEHSDRAKALYLNCMEFNTRHSILAAITNFLGYPMPRRGLATDEVFEKLTETLSKSNFHPIIILDEADQVLLEKEESKILYDILRIGQWVKKSVGLVMVSNDLTLLSFLDQRVKSSLKPETIVFEPYSPQQLKEIIKERAENAFLPGAFPQELLGLAAAHAAKQGGDARIAIESLLRAGREAEKAGKESLSAEELRKAFVKADQYFVTKLFSSLSSQEKAILKILAKQEDIISTKLYSLYKKKDPKPVSERMFRNYLNKLEALKMVDSTLKKTGNITKVREYSLRIDKNLVEEIK